MPDVSFQVTGVEACKRGLIPLLHFRIHIATATAGQLVQGMLLNAQIQIQTPQRRYEEGEKERLLELFGPPERWGQTLRNRLWTHANTTTGCFTGETDIILPVPCTYDLNVAATKYFYALEGGEIPLLFLFSGSIFYSTEDGRLQVERISWERECAYRVPVRVWKDLMEEHYPNSGWIVLRREAVDRLWAYKRRHGLATWDQAVDHLLDAQTAENAPLAVV